MSTNQKPSHPHRPVDKRNVPGFQKPKQRGSINQTEVSSAMAFLTGEALNQACSLLMAQSRELFGNFSSSQGVGKNSLHDESAVSDSDSLNQQSDASANKQQSSSRDYTKTLTSLYQKCKRAHEIIVHADELEQLDRSSGMNSIPSSPHPNSSISTPRSTHTTPGVILNSMPPPPPSLGGSNMPMPLLHRRSSSGPNAALLPNSNRLHFRRKPSDSASGNAHTPKLQRASSNAGDGTKSADQGQTSSAPPEEVLNFLKKLNANGEGGNDTSTAAAAVPTPAFANRDKKRNAISPPTNPIAVRELKRPPPPPTSTTSKKPSSVPDNPRNSTENNEMPTPEDKPSPGRRSTRSASKRTTPNQNVSYVYEVGESVMVKENDTWYAAIVKDVDYEEESGGTFRYEVEFDNGELGSVLPVDVRKNEAE
jgi:hypothetical protein